MTPYQATARLCRNLCLTAAAAIIAVILLIAIVNGWPGGDFGFGMRIG